MNFFAMADAVRRTMEMPIAVLDEAVDRASRWTRPCSPRASNRFATTREAAAVTRRARSRVVPALQPGKHDSDERSALEGLQGEESLDALGERRRT